MIVTEDVGVAQREAWANKVLPPVEQVRDGLWSIPVPMPDNPLRYVLVYALALDDGLALIDVGWDHEQSWQALVDGIASIGYHISEVRYAAITHLHPDHFGLAPRLRQVSGATLAMHVADATLLGYHGPEQTRDDISGWNLQLSELGAPAEVLDASRVDLVRFAEHETIDIVLGDGDSLDLPGWNLRASGHRGTLPDISASWKRTEACCSAAITCCRGSARTSPRFPVNSRTRFIVIFSRSRRRQHWASAKCFRHMNIDSVGSPIVHVN